MSEFSELPEFPELPEPPIAKASFQRSMNLLRCCSTNIGMSGPACAASKRSCPRWDCNISVSRAPSRSREASKSCTAVCVKCSTVCAVSALFLNALPAEPDKRNTSATLKLRASFRVAWISFSIVCSCSKIAVVGLVGKFCKEFSSAARISTLPRFRFAVTRVLSAGSFCLNSSGNLNDRSKKRLLTDRISIESCISPKAPLAKAVAVLA